MIKKKMVALEGEVKDLKPRLNRAEKDVDEEMLARSRSYAEI